MNSTDVEATLAMAEQSRERAELELERIAERRSELQRAENAAKKALVDAKIIIRKLAKRGPSAGG